MYILCVCSGTWCLPLAFFLSQHFKNYRLIYFVWVGVPQALVEVRGQLRESVIFLLSPRRSLVTSSGLHSGLGVGALTHGAISLAPPSYFFKRGCLIEIGAPDCTCSASPFGIVDTLITPGFIHECWGFELSFLCFHTLPNPLPRPMPVEFSYLEFDS